MQATERDEFNRMLRVLFAGLDKPLGEVKESAFWKALERMSLIEFGRCCDLILDELEDGDKRVGWSKHFTAGDVWAAKRRLRSRGNKQPDVAPIQPWSGDSWDERANRWLARHIATQALRGVHYATERDRNVYPRLPEWQPEAATRQMTAILVGYKNAWAVDMRQDAAEHGQPLDIDLQRNTFADCMRRADAEIAEFRQQSMAA